MYVLKSKTPCDSILDSGCKFPFFLLKDAIIALTQVFGMGNGSSRKVEGIGSVYIQIFDENIWIVERETLSDTLKYMDHKCSYGREKRGNEDMSCMGLRLQIDELGYTLMLPLIFKSKNQTCPYWCPRYHRRY